MAEQSNRVSYIKKPFAKNSFFAIGLTGGGLLFFAIGISSGIQTQGQIPLNMAAVCFSSFLLALAGVIYGAVSFSERDRNYILARISLIAGGLMLVIWLVLLIIGLR